MGASVEDYIRFNEIERKHAQQIARIYHHLSVALGLFAWIAIAPTFAAFFQTLGYISIEYVFIIAMAPVFLVAGWAMYRNKSRKAYNRANALRSHIERLRRQADS